MVDHHAVVRRVAKRIPGLRKLYRALRTAYTHYKLQRSTAEEIFTEIYAHNLWKGTASKSGTGSGPDQTRVLVRELPIMFRELGVSSLLDVPCGDFHWMKAVDLGGIEYTGGDIVRHLVQRNTQTYGRDGISFRHLDLMTDALPKADLLLCRDCLVHLSFADILRALGNICTSGSTYLLTTTFPGLDDNPEILTGEWRPLNLERPPFCLPPPERLVNEGCTELDGAYEDKSLGLWNIANIRRVVSRVTTA